MWSSGWRGRDASSKNARVAIEKARQAERGMAISDFNRCKLSTLFRKKEIACRQPGIFSV